ncbi:hypothetical protein V1478_012986 [Vespula squamosa]|uniref:Uncharacterized protein n=1 Tax=Vespula squamosa TaxID=30214 RepID=A0ABD2A9K3_VESSQ
MTGERCELRHRLKEGTGTHEGKADVPVNGAVVGSGVVSARLDMLVVGDTSVVRHIMPLIQCISGLQQALVCGTPRIGPSHFLMRNEESRYSAKTSMGYLWGERNFEISYAILCSLDIQQQTVNAKQLFPLSINLISRRDFVASGLKLQGSTKLNMLFEILPVCWHSLKREFIG